MRTRKNRKNIKKARSTRGGSLGGILILSALMLTVSAVAYGTYFKEEHTNKGNPYSYLTRT